MSRLNQKYWIINLLNQNVTNINSGMVKDVNLIEKIKI